MYEPRTYRDKIIESRFRSFFIEVEESDLWIGLNGQGIDEEEHNKILNYVHFLRKTLKDYINDHPEFLISHAPLKVLKGDPDIVKLMKNAGIAAGTGPMAAVAGLVSMKTCLMIGELYPESEIIVENGGDVFMKIKDDLLVNVFPSENSYFKDLALRIPGKEYNYLSVCSSSGVFGHSFSYGKADLVSVFSGDACLSDAWATSLANRIITKDDLENLHHELPEGIIAILAVKDDKLFYRGPFEFAKI